jgi:hypothetical protein
MKQSKKTFLLIGLFVFAALGMFFSGDKSFAQDSQISVETASNAAAGTGEEILALLAEFSVIKLDDAIFTDPIFLSLKDYHVDLVQEPKQRDNPFAPIGQDIIIEETAGTSVSVPVSAKTTRPPAPVR